MSLLTNSLLLVFVALAAHVCLLHSESPWVPWATQGTRDDGSTTDAARHVYMVLSADSGTYSGRHELYYIRSAMINVTEVEIPDCQSAHFGYLVTNKGKLLPSLLVTTGIFVTSSTACTLNIMQDARYVPKSIVFLGTSGISPTVGGWNPTIKGGCGILTSPRKNALGSVCITDAAILQECGICVEETFTSECSRPQCSLHNSSSSFGNCSYRHPTSLAAEMRRAMEGKEFPKMPDVVQKGSTSFWMAHQAVEDHTPPTNPRLLDCAETNTNQILAGARSDFICREYSSALLPEIPFEDHTCVQAMEGFGFLHVMSRFPKVPIVLVRAGSNYDMYPMSVSGETSDGTPLWVQNESFMPYSEYDEFTKASYRYAVLTSSMVVLNYLTGNSVISVD